jgi:hypothetical protein
MEKSSGEWWRFSRYEVREGYIRPAAGASLNPIDAWDRYWQRPEGHTDFPPYHQLGELVRDVPRDQDFTAPVPETDTLRKEVLAWCRQYGLLGLLPHTLLSVRLETWLATRTANGWEDAYYSWEPGPFEGFPEEAIEDEFGQGLAFYPDAELSWWRFFPDITAENRGAGGRLLPLSEPFWEQYGEPWHLFLDTARYFTNAIEVISDPEGASIIEYRNQPLDKKAAIERINQLASGVTPSISVDRRGRYRQSWKSPSLLGHLAMQASQDLLGHRPPTKCPCGVKFASSHPRAKYCSELCANRYRKRAQRDRERKSTSRTKSHNPN